MNTCPCGSTKEYRHCCEPIHIDHRAAQTPEQLMRSRYTAHVMGLVNFVIDTYHPSCLAGEQREQIEESVESEWSHLEVVSTELGKDKDEGYVTFKAYFQDNGNTLCLEEKSRFIRENQFWYYIDGVFPEPKKVGRNDPCICGSGKKYKKCCGR